MTLDLDAIQQRGEVIIRFEGEADPSYVQTLAADVLALVARVRNLEIERELYLADQEKLVARVHELEASERALAEMGRDLTIAVHKAEAERDTLREALLCISTIEYTGEDTLLEPWQSIARDALTQGAGE